MEQCQGPGQDAGEDCGKPVHRGRDCRGHYEQRRRSGTLSPLSVVHSRNARSERADPLEELREAIYAHAEAPSEDDAEAKRCWEMVLTKARAIPPAGSRPRVPEGVRSAILKARERGQSLRAIAERFCVSPETVRRLCR